MRCRVCGAPMRDGEGTFVVPYKGKKGYTQLVVEWVSHGKEDLWL